VNAKIEVGTLWIGKEYWGKLLELKNETAFELLKFCFEDLTVNKIEFRVDYKNIKSQNLIKKMGGKFDGNLRQDVKVKGVYSDSLVFSILREEWDGIKKNLTQTF
jgi:RimJ/RimL family protein N-acetyltransferase